MKKLLSFLTIVLLLNGCKKSEPEPTPFSIQNFDPAQGVVGTVVTITGEGFSTDLARNVVKFGTGVATVTGASASQLTVTVPASAQSGKITVEVDGRTTTSSADFTFIDGPVITSFTPQQAEEGETVRINGLNFSNNTSAKFNGVASKGVTRLSNTQLDVVIPDGATTGKIVLEDAGKSFTSTQDFTVIVPLSSKSTITKLVGIPAFATNGADGVRMAYTSNSIYLTGPGQKTVYKMDLTTLGVAPFQTITGEPVGIAATGDQVYFGDTDAGYFYTYRFDKLSKSTSADANARPFSLKPGGATGKYTYLSANFNNEIIGIVNGTAGGNSSSSFSTTVVNTQLKGTPDQANAHLATNTKSVFVFCNQALWKLQTNNTLTLVAGAAGQKGYVDGAGAAARFQDGGYARGNAIAVDEADNVYVTDYGSGCIRKVDASGNVTTVVGNKKFFGTTIKPGKGHRTAFRFDQFDIATGADGALYVVANNDVQSQTLRFAVYKITFDK
ncbi:IPT/TIG domain-containing protein [Spirosoma sp. BT702]|uniref:IPT/TIG domain-containing protein n=1 Tax=Spirosoma profusum TaxID=2771354 RepID=A0A926XZG9_9BACT|nr:IPT/TIG domain-containing protein [Spirosoma profusum]MBD2703849.1 IPT/TIG domain-containing protein [Spirosoma profusum]